MSETEREGEGQGKGGGPVSFLFCWELPSLVRTLFCFSSILSSFPIGASLPHSFWWLHSTLWPEGPGPVAGPSAGSRLEMAVFESASFVRAPRGQSPRALSVS